MSGPTGAPTRITVYGCLPDEADAFRELSPRFGVVPTILHEDPSGSDGPATPVHRCISVGHRSEIPRRVLHTLRDAGVEYISTRSIGFDHIDHDAADDLGITVENVVYAPDGVADHTVMLILMAIRGAGETLRATARNDFRLPAARGRDLCDLTVGVVGVGHVGRAVIQRLQGFGCRVLATGHVPLPDLLRQSDVVTLHLPLDERTHHIIGREQIAAMRDDAILVNTGRGALVDTDALVVALERGRLGGAALDVLEGEEGIFYADCRTRPIAHPLLPRLQRLPSVIVTPHTAYFTRRTLRDTVEKTLVSCTTFEGNRANENRADGQTQDRDRVRGPLRGT